MTLLLKLLGLVSYWVFLTKSLLMTAPWELFSRRIAANPPMDLAYEPNSWLAHMSAYGLLGFFILETAPAKSRMRWGLLLLALIHSGACEYLQKFIPGRWPNGWDIAANSLGLMLSFGLHKALTFHFQNFPLNTFPKKPAA